MTADEGQVDQPAISFAYEKSSSSDTVNIAPAPAPIVETALVSRGEEDSAKSHTESSVPSPAEPNLSATTSFKETHVSSAPVLSAATVQPRVFVPPQPLQVHPDASAKLDMLIVALAALLLALVIRKLSG